MTDRWYVTDLQQRCPIRGELFLMAEARNALARCQPGESFGPSVILTPVSPGAVVGECVLVPAALVERLREADSHLTVDTRFDDIGRALYGTVRALLSAVPPPAPADPLESDEFQILATAGSVAQLKSYLRRHAAEIARREAEAEKDEAT